MKTYELNGASATSAMLWFLRHERLRHYQDIEAIERDIEGLLAMKVKLPDHPPLDTFITIPGDHTTVCQDHIADVTEMVYLPISKGQT
jgi:hypothetical protein